MPGAMWTLDKEIRLIEHYKSYRFLWDPFDGDYYRKDMRALTFEKIQQSLGDPKMSVGDVKKKIQHLRTSFTREARRKRLFRIYNAPGSEPKPMFSKWVHFHRMLFLKDVIEERGLRLQQEMGQVDIDDERLDMLDNARSSPFTAATLLHTNSLVSPPTCPITCSMVTSSNIKEEQSSLADMSPDLQDHITTYPSPSSDLYPDRYPDLQSNKSHSSSATTSTSTNLPVTNNHTATDSPLRRSVEQQLEEEMKNKRRRLFVKQEDNVVEEYFGYHVAVSLSKMSIPAREAAKLAIQQVLFSYSLSQTSEEDRVESDKIAEHNSKQSRTDILDAIGQIIKSTG